MLLFVRRCAVACPSNLKKNVCSYLLRSCALSRVLRALPCSTDRVLYFRLRRRPRVCAVLPLACVDVKSSRAGRAGRAGRASARDGRRVFRFRAGSYLAAIGSRIASHASIRINRRAMHDRLSDQSIDLIFDITAPD